MKLTTMVTLVSVSVLLSACFGGAAKPVTVAQYDLGDVGNLGGSAKSDLNLPLRSVDVHAPSWLSKATMQYRLAYADAGRRDAYTESRWAAAPGELLEVSLRRRLGLVDEAGDSAGCRLRVELDEFVQVFDSAQQSRAVIAARLAVQAPRSDEVLARKALQLSKPTSSPDARGGVAAFSSSAIEIGNEAGLWLAALAKDQPALIKRCRAK